jgi:hypothetical protein
MMDLTNVFRVLHGLPLPFPDNSGHPPAETATVKLLLQDHPALQGSSLEALMWVRIGDIEPAHALVQSATRGLEAYIHGVIHRIEGDFWNAKYWFRQVRAPELLAKIQSHVEHGTAILGSKDSRTATWVGPIDFVDAWEKAVSNRTPDGNGPGNGPGQKNDVLRLRQNALLEWEALWLTASDRF